MQPLKTIVLRWFSEQRARGRMRVFAGIGLVLHGLAHAAFPLRGAGMMANTALARAFVHLGWGLAMVGFVAAGFGVLGAWPWRRIWRPLMAIAVAASVVAFAALRKVDLFPGLAIDALAMVVFYRVKAPATPLGSIAASRWRRYVAAAGSVSAALFTIYVAVCATTRPWHHRWGVTEKETELVFPGDFPDRDPAFEVNHAVTIEARAADVWPWLVQIGQDKGGFYSYDELENLFGLRIQNADRIHAAWQNAAVGDLVRAAPPDWMGGLFGEDVGWILTHLEPERALVLRWWGAFVLVPTPDDRTRLFVRSKISSPDVPVWAAALSFTTFELPHFIMERRMLLGIKARAERRRELPPAPYAAPQTAVAID